MAAKLCQYCACPRCDRARHPGHACEERDVIDQAARLLSRARASLGPNDLEVQEAIDGWMAPEKDPDVR